MSSHEKEVPMIVFAKDEFCKPNVSIIFKYCKNSMITEKVKTIIADVRIFRFKNDFKKQYSNITTKKSPK